MKIYNSHSILNMRKYNLPASNMTAHPDDGTLYHSSKPFVECFFYRISHTVTPEIDYAYPQDSKF